jgi:pimeloyl-ACP methyl ester carboxylesterase
MLLRRIAIALTLICAISPNVRAAVTRKDFFVTTSDHVRIFVREMRPAHSSGTGSEPIILLHGARVPGIGSFDLPVANGSLAANIVKRIGRTVYVLDARGYGKSQRPAAMDAAPEESQPLSRAYEIMRDIDAVVQEAEHRNHVHSVALFGWATGGMWAGYYASLHPEQVKYLITLNALYGGSNKHAMIGPGSSLADLQHPDHIDPKLGGYNFNTGPSLFRAWNEAIPVANKDEWRDPAIAKAYENAAMESDPTSESRNPRSFRAPMGAMEDSFYQVSGRRLYDASSITSHVLLIRSQYDFWSSPEDVQAFAHDAAHATELRIVNLAGATHHVHLDRAEHGRNQLLQEISNFLAAP